MASTSTLPAGPAAASSAALEAAIAEKNGTNGDITEATSEAKGAGAEQSGESGEAASDSQIRTVFTDPENFNVKHPLYNRWTLWFDNPSAKGLGKASGGKDSWGEDLNKVVDFDSVEEFWGLYDNVIPPSALPQKANYYLFKEGIKPAWEDSANSNGGKWSIQLPRDKSRAAIDKLWLYTMLSAIGETMEAESTPAGASELITGVIMSARPQFYRIAIWTRQADDPVEEAAAGTAGCRLLEIGRHLKTSILGYKLNEKIGSGGLTSEVEFQSHKESEKKRGKKFVA